MQLVVLGLNDKTAPVEVRESFSLTDEELYLGLKAICEYDKIREMVILSTCNRMEIYAVIDEASDAFMYLRAFLLELVGYKEGTENCLFFYTGRDCIRHLYNVASSLDSLVIGEGQILSQVKKAYSIAREAESTSTVLNILFHRAITIGKRVRTETKIAHSTVSVSSAAVELVKEIYGDCSNIKALVIGAGKMGELAALNLKSKSCRNVFVANRDIKRAVELAEKTDAQPVHFENIVECAQDMDVVITSTGAMHYIVKKEEIKKVMDKRPDRKLVLIDIAVPRDIEPEVALVDGVRLCNIDDLKAVVDTNRSLRAGEAARARKIIDEETENLAERFHYLSFQPVIALLASRMEKMRQRELKRAMAKLPELTQDEYRVIENMSHTIIRKMLREPMIAINNAAGGENEEYYVKAMRGLFKLDVVMENIYEKENHDWDKEQQACPLAGQSH